MITAVLMVWAGLILLPVCMVMGAWGLVTTVRGLAMRRRASWVRGSARVCLAVGIGGYAVGAALVGFAQSDSYSGTDSSPAPACQRDRSSVVDHRAGYVPLRFDCERNDGTTYSAGVVSGWLTPAAVVLTAAGTALRVRGARWRLNGVR